MPRRLDAEESALWARVTSTVRPLHRKPAITPAAKAETPTPVTPTIIGARPQPSSKAALKSPARPAASNTLDGGWDRRISAGRIAPDMTVDLHGHTLTSAHAMLEQRLGEAIMQDMRVILVITGRPPRPNQDPERPRGLIRQQLPHWLASSSYRNAIAAVRNAHPRHGGAGALYLVLRRRRETAVSA